MKAKALPLLVGFALDAALGDPHSWPHPVRGIGKLAQAAESVARNKAAPALCRMFGDRGLDPSGAQRLAGAGIVAVTCAAATLACAGCIRVAHHIHPAVGLAAESVACYQLLAARSLRDESMAVQERLEAEDLSGARRAVSMIVGRDTAALDEAGIIRAAVETVAENASDGVVAPLLYAGVGGAPAMMLYKAVNTLDSMMGYKNERYLNLGWAAAKLDDLANFIPARVSGMLMCAAAGLCGLDARGAWRVFERDRLNHSSPNSAHTEAACAGALGVQLGGPARYFGAVVRKPTIGRATRSLEPADIARANRLMGATSLLALALSAAIRDRTA